MASSTSLPGSNTGVVVRHVVAYFSERWIVPEGTVPEAPWHDEAAELFRQILRAFVARSRRAAVVYRNIAVRVDEARPSLGFDPDVCVIEPPPPEHANVDSIRLWEPGHTAPRLSMEVVSKNHPYKDYVEIPDQCAATGVIELAVFDPKRSGPRVLGRTPLLSLWQRTADGGFERVFAGDGAVFSSYLSAWLVPTAEGQLLRIADDADGRRLWLTGEEAERAAREAEQAASRRRIAELEAQLQKR